LRRFRIENIKMKIIATHGGIFHADDVFAVSILKLIYPKAKVIRTRDSAEYNKADVRVDIGRDYNPKKGNFDHHQEGGAGKRKNGVPYASAGLIWKHFGESLVSSKEVLNRLDERIFQHVDANDSGYSTIKAEIHPYTIDNVIETFNVSWPKDGDDSEYNKLFGEVVVFLIKLLKKEIERAEGVVKARSIVRKAIRENRDKGNKEYLVLGEYVPWKEVVIKESDLKFVIIKDKKRKTWSAIAVPKEIGSFENRVDFPKNWGGLEGGELVKVSVLLPLLLSSS